MSVLRDSTRASSPGTSRTTPCMKSMNPKWEDENKNRCILVSTVLGGQNIVHERTVSWRKTRAVVWQILGWTSCMSSSGSLSCQFQFFGAQQRPIQAVFFCFYFLSGVRCSWINYWISEKWNLYKTGSWSWSWILMFFFVLCSQAMCSRQMWRLSERQVPTRCANPWSLPLAIFLEDWRIHLTQPI